VRRGTSTCQVNRSLPKRVLMDSPVRSRWAELGALGTAGTVAATIFCCLPFATGIIGAGVAAVGARFAPLQPYLVAASLASLGYAFYQAYRPDGVVCVGERGDVPSSLRYRRLTVWIMAVVVVLLLTASWWAEWVIYWTL
jgi:mercuric ion transport protein